MDKIRLMYPNVGEDALDLVREVIDSGHLVEGPKVREFEDTVKNYAGADFAIACTSATTGLELALRALDVGPGDEVVVPDFTHPATALVVQTLGAEPILVDVDLRSYNTTAALIHKALTSKTKAIIPVSIFGNPLEMDPIQNLADENGIKVIEDAACSLGSEYRGRKIGSLTDITVFSFHPRKVFATGDGGLILTSNEEYASRMISMKKFGVGMHNGKAAFVSWGTNYRMSDVLGAVALSQVRRLDEIVRTRIEKAAVYDELFAEYDEIIPPAIESGNRSNYQTYSVFIKSADRDKVLRQMRERGIEVQIGTYALHTLPVFETLKRADYLENSLSLSKNLLALPLHAKLTRDDQVRVVDNLKDVLLALE